nr:hypothetical protein [Tanacetum cinerariifolium]
MKYTCIGFDADETFSLVVKPATLQTVLSLATTQYWHVHQLNVKNAFLHGDLSELVYMYKPLGFRDSTHRDYVCLLQRSLYGLKQGTDTGYLLLYVDDILLTGSSERQYATEILEQAHTFNCNPIQTPIDTESKLGADGDSIGLDALLLDDCLRVIVCFLATTYSLGLLSVDRRCLGLVLRQSIMILPMLLLRHVVCDLVVAGHVRVLHVPCRYQYANIFTKETIPPGPIALTPLGTDTAYLLLYVDDILLTGSSERQYATEILEQAHTFNCNPIQTPIDTESKLGADGDSIGLDALLLDDCLRVIVCFLATTYSLGLLSVDRRCLGLVLRQSIMILPMLLLRHVVCDLVVAGHVRVLHVPCRYQYANIFTKGLPSASFEKFRTSLSVRCPPAQTTEEC